MLEIDEVYAQLCFEFKSKTSELDLRTNPTQLSDSLFAERSHIDPNGVFIIFEHVGNGYYNFRYHGDKKHFSAMLYLTRMPVPKPEELDEKPALPNMESLVYGIQSVFTIRNKVPILLEGPCRPPIHRPMVSIMLRMERQVCIGGCTGRCECFRLISPKYYDPIPKRDEISDEIKKVEAKINKLKFDRDNQKEQQAANKKSASKPKKVNSLRSALQKVQIKTEIVETPIEKTNEDTEDTEKTLQTCKQPGSANKPKHQGKAKTFRRKTKRSGRV